MNILLEQKFLTKHETIPFSRIKLEDYEPAILEAMKIEDEEIAAITATEEYKDMALYPYYGSDVGAMWRAGNDVPGALIGPGVHASHGMERTHADALVATVELILMYFGV